MYQHTAQSIPSESHPALYRPLKKKKFSLFWDCGLATTTLQIPRQRGSHGNCFQNTITLREGRMDPLSAGAQAEPFVPLTHPLHRHWSGTHDADWDTCSDAQIVHIVFVVVGEFFLFFHFNWCSTTFFVFYVALVKKVAACLPAPHNISAKSSSQGNRTPGG